MTPTERAAVRVEIDHFPKGVTRYRAYCEHGSMFTSPYLDRATTASYRAYWRSFAEQAAGSACRLWCPTKERT